MQKTTIILVRHCEAQGNVERIFQGHWNGKITDNGVSQLAHLSERMKMFPFDYLYSSPLSRTVATARACNMAYHLPIHVIGGVIEINGGRWEGKKFASFPTDYPESAGIWVKTPWDFVAPEGESMAQVYARMRETMTELAHKHAGKRICVVSHGCAIRNFLCYANGWELSKLDQVEWCDNTGISVVEFDQNWRPTVLCANDSSHIPSERATLAKQSWWKNENKEQVHLSFAD